jgi:hypothetical protein
VCLSVSEPCRLAKVGQTMRSAVKALCAHNGVERAGNVKLAARAGADQPTLRTRLLESFPVAAAGLMVDVEATAVHIADIELDTGKWFHS